MKLWAQDPIRISPKVVSEKDEEGEVSLVQCSPSADFGLGQLPVCPKLPTIFSQESMRRISPCSSKPVSTGGYKKQQEGTATY
jgi:hypothetical protein